MYPCVPVPGLYRGGPAQGDRGGEGGHQETQVLPADQEGGGEQNTQGERRAWHLDGCFLNYPMRKKAPPDIWRMFSELWYACAKCATCHLTIVFWMHHLTSDGCFLNYHAQNALRDIWRMFSELLLRKNAPPDIWQMFSELCMRKMRRLTSGGCFPSYNAQKCTAGHLTDVFWTTPCAKIHRLRSDGCFLNYHAQNAPPDIWRMFSELRMRKNAPPAIWRMFSELRMRKNAPPAIWRMFSELPCAKCNTWHLTDVFWTTMRKMRHLTSDRCFLNYHAQKWTAWHLANVFWFTMRKNAPTDLWRIYLA